MQIQRVLLMSQKREITGREIYAALFTAWRAYEVLTHSRVPDEMEDYICDMVLTGLYTEDAKEKIMHIAELMKEVEQDVDFDRKSVFRCGPKK